MLGVDQNQNDLSDVYESLYPGLGSASQDADADGQSNRQECAAGTNPLNPADRLDFANVNSEIAGIRTDWPTQAGKQYQLQIAATLSGPWVNQGAPVVGDGTSFTSVCPRNGSLQFMRMQVQDIDSDADGVTDWEELKAGTDRLLADTDGDGLADGLEITPTAPRIASNPTLADSDADGLSDLLENNTGTYLSATDPGTSPVDFDSDDDQFPDAYEISRNSNPLDGTQLPTLPTPLTVSALTTDETSGIDPARTYTHAISGGSPATINGVPFTALTAANTAIQQANQTIQKLTAERDALAKRLNDTTAKYNKLAAP